MVCVGIMFFSSPVLLAQDQKSESNSFEYILDSIHSEFMEEEKAIKIYLPEGYSEEKVYPVIYTLDAEWMFEPTTTEVKKLADFDVIPECIVVGLFHESRDKDLGTDWSEGTFDKNGLAFYHYLSEELIPQIDARYSTSGFNTLVGHSNGATFSTHVMIEEDQPFGGFVALSQNLFGSQKNKYSEFLKQSRDETLFYFVASGQRDPLDRLESGLALDSLFKTNSNEGIITQHKIYDADHDGIAALGLGDGLVHVFSKYKRYNAENYELMDELMAKGVSAYEFIENHARKLNQLYGIDYEIKQSDIGFMDGMAQTTEELESLEKFEIEHLGKSEDFYSSYAQSYEYIKNYDKALAYWKRYLEINESTVSHPFYFKRTIQLLYSKMNQPLDAIRFALEWKEKKNELAPYFNYWIAVIARAEKIETKTGLSSIKEYIANYDEEYPFDLAQAKEIENDLSTE